MQKLFSLTSVFIRSFTVLCASFSILMELAAVKFVFWFMVVRLEEMLAWLVCLIVSKSV
jgi:hypothetical protein